MLRVTTFFYRIITNSTLNSSWKIDSIKLWRCIGRNRNNLKAEAVRLFHSKTIFRFHVTTHFHQTGLSISFIKTYSSLQCVLIVFSCVSNLSLNIQGFSLFVNTKKNKKIRRKNVSSFFLSCKHSASQKQIRYAIVGFRSLRRSKNKQSRE